MCYKSLGFKKHYCDTTKRLFTHTSSGGIFFYQQYPEGLTLPESKDIHSGVPQRCVSNPILFALHSNPSTFNLKFSVDAAILGLWIQTLKLQSISSTIVSLKTP